MCCAIQLVAGFNTARSLLGVVRPRRAAPPRVCRPWTRRRASALLRHRSRACRPPGTDSADTGQPRESTVQTLRSAVMRRVAAGGKLECVFPWKLAPSITRTGRASEKPGLTKPPTAAYRRGAVAVSPPSVRARGHIPSLNRSERRAKQCMQEIFRSNFTSKRKRSRFSAPLRGHRPMPVPADWGPLFPKSTYREVADIGPENAPL